MPILGMRRKPMIGAGARQRGRQTRRPMQRQQPMQRPTQQRRRPGERPRMEKRPEWARSGWSRIPVIGRFIDLIRNIFFSRERFRVTKRRIVGPGFKGAFGARMRRAQRTALPSPRGEAKILRNRTPGLPQTMAFQHQKGRIRGVPKYRGQKAA